MEEQKKKIRIEFDEATAWKIATVVLGILFIVSIFTKGFSGTGAVVNVPSADNQQVPTANAPSAPQAPQYIDVSEDDDPVLGDPDAPITIIEFSDYQCPFCERFFQQTLPSIKSDYIDDGKAKLVYRDFPLPFHPNADDAAVAANCAGEQGKYFEMHDKLFEAQAAWSGLQDPNAEFTGYAKGLGLDEKKFTNCLADPKVKAEIQADATDGAQAGVSGTPSFFVNGRLLVGAQPYAAFKAVIDDELSK